MIDPNISDFEKACIRRFAKEFETGHEWLSNPTEEFPDEPPEKVIAMMRVLDHFGAFKRAEHSTAGMYCIVHLSAKVILLARELDAMDAQKVAPGDIVANITKSARSNPIMAYSIIGILVLTAILSIIENGAKALERFGLISKSVPPVSQSLPATKGDSSRQPSSPE